MTQRKDAAMAARRARELYSTETHTTTSSTNGSGRWWSSVAAAILPILFTLAFGGLITMMIFYVSGTYKIAEHDKHFDALEAKLTLERTDREKRFNDFVSKMGEIKRTDEDRRGTIRDEFLKRSEQTADGISKLNTQAAVQDTTMKQVLAQLEKLNLRMETTTAILPSPKR
jgi:hypothetical protein